MPTASALLCPASLKGVLAAADAAAALAGGFREEGVAVDECPVADGDLKCWGLTSWEFRPLVESNAQIAWALLQTLAKRLRES